MSITDTITQLGKRRDHTLAVGDDYVWALTVTEDGVPFDWTGATTEVVIKEQSGDIAAANWNVTLATGSLALSLSDTATSTLRTGTFSYSFRVTKNGFSRVWLAGLIYIKPTTTAGESTGRTGTITLVTETSTLELTTAIAVTIIEDNTPGAPGFTEVPLATFLASPSTYIGSADLFVIVP